MIQTPITSNQLAILGTMQLGQDKMWRPSRVWNLGLLPNATANQVQQIKAATVSGASATVGVQGIPMPVQNLQVTRTPVNATQVKVNVSFSPHPSDRYFQGVSVLLAQGDGTPVQLVTGKTSPISFVVAKSARSSNVIIQTNGSFGSTPLNNSPSRTIALT
ncbi:MAG TPA: hypothetical protein VHA06_09075 [Candidatus Angelobacter sp.]|jgi:hypothetical protein|nr:hypothetical protein [Candidatus Angelobacter sp.]